MQGTYFLTKANDGKWEIPDAEKQKELISSLSPSRISGLLGRENFADRAAEQEEKNYFGKKVDKNYWDYYNQEENKETCQ